MASQAANTFANPSELSFPFSSWHPDRAAGLGAVSLLPSYYPFLLLLSCFSFLSSSTIRALLLIAGVEPNPGPSYPCGVCSTEVTWRGTSFLCHGCSSWVHKRCSGLSFTSNYSPDWRCRSCMAGGAPAADDPVMDGQLVDHSGLSADPGEPVPQCHTHPNPQHLPSSGLSILQLNCNGLQHCQQELSAYLQDKKIFIACLQETKLTSTSNAPSFVNYNLVRRDRPSQDGGGGLAFLVHHSVSFLPYNTDQFFQHDNVTEHQGIIITLPGGTSSLHIVNIYIPPCTSCPPGHTVVLDPLFGDLQLHDSLITGDFNAHNPAWFSNTDDHRAESRGEILIDLINASNLSLLNKDTPTRLPRAGRSSSPDLTLISSHLVLDAGWYTEVSLGSDHLPILISVTDMAYSYKGEQRCFTNYRRADWTGFQREVENLLQNSPPPSSADSGEVILREIVLTASKHHIPSGVRRDFIPKLNDEAKQLIRNRDNIRKDNPNHPDINQISLQLKTAIAVSAKQAWITEVESCNHRTHSRHFWSLLKRLSGKQSRRDSNQPIMFNGCYYNNDKDIALNFTRQFTRPAPHQQSAVTRKLQREIRRDHPLDHNALFFTPHAVEEAIKQSGTSSATGPDGLNILHFRNLGPLAVSYLTSILNLSLQHACIPSVWKLATIICLPKPGKPIDQGTSYRPISLLCPASKVLERLLLPLLREHLPVAEHQHGFRQGRSTTSALLPITHQVVSGFNQPKPPLRTVALAIDFSKAFDTVDHNQLLTMISGTPLDHNIVRWCSTYLRGRMSACRFGLKTSPYQHVRCGVPQGSVISPILFNSFVSDFPQTASMITSYADDFTSAESSVNIHLASERLSAHANDVLLWAEQKKLSISFDKSHPTILTSDTHQCSTDPGVSMGQNALEPERNPKILGVYFDPLFKFSHHVSQVQSRVSSRINILKALAGTNWGQQKETIIVTYRALIRSIVTYAAPIWYPNASATSVRKLQVLQNSALRVATGCHRMAPVAHLHREALMLPVDDTLQLLCKQYLASAMVPEHPCHATVTSCSGPRSIRHTLQSRFLPSIQQFLVNNTIPLDSKKTTLTTLHNDAVRVAIAASSGNRLLDAPAPLVSGEELSLPRPARTALSQLRSGYCAALNDYQFRVGRSPTADCPLCNRSEHTVSHLFNCPEQPTVLDIHDMWSNPVDVANFISSLPFFSYLPPLRRPPPEPPP